MARRESRLLDRRIGPVPLWLALVGSLVVLVVVAFAAANTLSGRGGGGNGADAPRIRYDVGDPGPGEMAPDFELPAVDGSNFRLSEQIGREILLYFHEGLMCDPCWRQVDDVQADLAKFRDVGIDEVVAISIDSLSAQRQRAQTRGIGMPVLADVDRSVSAAYDALSYGMMGGSTPGHTFVLVGPDGRIRWRADYGGAPNFTMFVPNETLLAELRDVSRT